MNPPLRGSSALWLGWSFASMVGGGLGLLLGPAAAIAILAASFGIVDPTLGRTPPARPLYYLYAAVGLVIWLSALGVGAGIVGAVLGASQYLLLRRQPPLSRRWVWVTAGGWAVGMPLGWIAILVGFPQLPDILSLTLVGAFTGTLVGIGQWLVLRRRVRYAGWWIGATMLAYVASWFCGGLLLQSVRPPVGYLAEGALGGLIGGAITGGVLVWYVKGMPQQAGV